MNHSFDIEDAKAYGIPAAVLLENFRFWIAKNRANDVHQMDGRTWSYNSVKAFHELFPYMGIKQIRAALDKLVEDGILMKRDWNEGKSDRTLWYAFRDENAFIGAPAHLPKKANHLPKRGKACAQKGKCTNTTDINTDINTDAVQLSSTEVIFDDWMAAVKAEGKKPIPEDHEVFRYADKIELPIGYVHLCWFEFKRTFAGNSKKKYSNWAKTFSNYVRKNYFGLWFEKAGVWQLTTAGKQLNKELEGTV